MIVPSTLFSCLLILLHGPLVFIMHQLGVYLLCDGGAHYGSKSRWAHCLTSIYREEKGTFDINLRSNLAVRKKKPALHS